MSNDAVSSKVQAVIELFAESLAHVSFPGVDHQSFLVLADAAQAQAAEVEAARSLLEQARAGLEVRRRELLEHARLGLAYAEIYARTEPALTDCVQAMAESLREPARRPRSRSRKKARETPPEELPLVAQG